VRIAWFTPLSTRSAIGEFSIHVAAALAELAEVEIWTADEPPHHATHLRVISFSRASEHLDLLPQRDAVVYNMGDYLPFHREIHKVAQRYPGVVILHDRVMHHLYAGMWLMDADPSRETYVERMGSYYGEAGREAARGSLEGSRRPVWESDDEVLRFPLYEEAILNAHGVATHSQGQAEDIRRHWPGPVEALHLPCYREIRERIVEPPRRSRDDGRLSLLTIGHLNPNKQAHRVVEMLAADAALAGRVRYTIVGPDEGFEDYIAELRRLVDRHSGQLSVDILGWQPEEELDRLMGEADVFVNLRHPVMEGSSASLMRQLAYGRPVLCFDSGFFGELPQDAVLRVADGDFAAAALQLRAIVEDRESRQRIGRRARELAASYDERSYAESLLALIERSRLAAPAMDCLDAAARTLGEMNVDSRLPTFDDIAEDFARILRL
jgi:glycosyltransferase involved in cell wall biosynthesis